MKASPMLTFDLASFREDRARHKSLARWEDDGGRVLEKPAALWTGLSPGGAPSPAQSTTV